MGRTTKPCPGCGEVDGRRAANEVCPRCKKILKLHPEMCEALRDRTPEKELFAFHATQHWNPCFYGPFDFSRTYSPDDVRSQLNRVFTEAMVCLSEPVGPDEGDPWNHKQFLMRGHTTAKHETGDGFHGNGPENYVRFAPEQAIAIRRLWNVIYDSLTAVYAAGVDKGEGFIQQLADGEVSVADYSDREARK